MTRTEALLLAQVVGIAVVAVGVIFAFQLDSSRTLGLSATPPPQNAAVSGEQDGLPTGTMVWVPVEHLEHIIGPWRTSDGAVLVAISARSELTPQIEAPNARWRLTVEAQGGNPITCGIYDGLQRSTSTPEATPWRLGYCRGLPSDLGGPAAATRIVLLRSPGQEQIRLLLGAELDIELFQVK